ncbi:hypothetical protein [Streptomyces boluensis]|uniref:Uncharacterized protein n=1 Tax=Streptomyces boluensis TaxID=1775135 RepID=A0A964XIU2_9ACTN|nr:hypothetical protein [Streptomyces boluensis]NBE50604.1 hypothetical protein [Streptomyces boluensis]
MRPFWKKKPRTTTTSASEQTHPVTDRAPAAEGGTGSDGAGGVAAG